MTEDEYSEWYRARIEDIKKRFPFVRYIRTDGDPYVVTAWFIFGGSCHYGSLEQLEEYCAECEKALMASIFKKEAEPTEAVTIKEL